MADSDGFRFRGIAGLGLSLIAGRAGQALAFLLMARFLTAAQMGKVAIFTAVFLGMYQLTSIGFDRYIVYAKAEDGEELERTIDGVWSLQIARGVLIMVLAVPIYLLLRLFPQLGVTIDEVLMIGAIVFAFSLATPELSSFERKGDFGYVSKARGAGLVFGALVTIGLIFIWQSPWVYLIGQMGTALLFSALSYYYSTRLPRLQFEREQISRIWDYSRHLIVIAIVSFISTQAQSIYVGAAFGAATLGMYFTWYRLVSLPGEFITQMQDRLLFAKASDDSRREKDAGLTHLLGFGLSMGLLVPFYIFVWFHGDTLMTVLATDRWVPFWWVGKMFVWISFLSSLMATLTPFFLVSLPQVTSRLRLIEASLGFGLILLLGGIYGIAGVLIALLIELSLAISARTYFLYRRIITANRLFHAKSTLLILAAIPVPIFAWEALAAGLFPAEYFPYLSALFYALWFGVLSCAVFLKRGQIMSKVTS